MYAIATIIVGILAYGSKSFLAILESTAAGRDEVDWGLEDSYYEAILDELTLAWLAGTWLLPLIALIQLFAPEMWRTNPLAILLLGGLDVWLFFPICLLSAYSAGSAFVIFRKEVFAVLARAARFTVRFYLATLLVVAAGVGLWVPALGGYPGLVPVAAGVGAACSLIYARLLGRLAWVLTGAPQRPAPENLRADPRLPAGAIPQQGRPGIVNQPEKNDDPALRKDWKDDPTFAQAQQLFQPIRFRVEQGLARLRLAELEGGFHDGIWGFPFRSSVLGVWFLLSLAGIVVGYLVLLLLTPLN